ncbi:MAG: hypothetical protein OXC37_02480 [Bdellovibrionaceae bacterium]|nr:hypothetical protein [Pseudobdellovibrionaceae bacterium]
MKKVLILISLFSFQIFADTKAKQCTITLPKDCERIVNSDFLISEAEEVWILWVTCQTKDGGYTKYLYQDWYSTYTNYSNKLSVPDQINFEIGDDQKWQCEY